MTENKPFCTKYKLLRNTPREAARWLRDIAAQSTKLFAHWELSMVP